MTDDDAARATAARLSALDSYAILDTTPEPGYDDIVLLASRLCETPVALVSFVVDTRQWFKARVGFPPCETPLSQSVCAHALASDEVFVIPDLTLDERTRHNTLVTGEPHIRFYAGARLQTPEGIALGTLCVIDTVPRPAGLTAIQMESLQALARQVMAQMEMRRLFAAKQADAVAAQQHHNMLKAEMGHRLKNILSIVQAIIAQTLRGATDLVEARRVLGDRIIALARAQDILSGRAVESADLATVVRSAAQLQDQRADQRFQARGPQIEVGAKAAHSLSLMMHELATNALKYGALSSDQGRVDIDWHVTTIGQEAWLELTWRESGGPSVSPPTRRGFGTRLIERVLAHEVGGTVALDYRPAGLACRLNAPLAALR